jgi:hypothetical protein
MDSVPVFPSVYLAPISYFSELIKYDQVMIEHFENFKKQSIRNHCVIYSPNGPLKLSIPLYKRSERTLTKEIIISDSYGWQKLHWRSLESAYRSSPFFEFYEHDFLPLYEKPFKYLVEFNNEIMQLILRLLKIKTEIKPTLSYEKEYVKDYRNFFSEKANHSDHPPYTQVFSNKHGFLADLSIADLLFNQGPSAKEYF